MRYFFIYWCAIIAAIYVFSTAISGVWVPIFYIFFGLSILAANVALVRKKIGAAIGLGTFSCFLIPTVWISGKIVASTNTIHWELLWVIAFVFFVFWSIYESYKAVFKKQELGWGDSNNIPHILKIILVLIQVIIAWIAYSNG